MRFSSFGRPRGRQRPAHPGAPAVPVATRSQRRLSSAAFRALVCIVLAAACSPAYNWRTVTDVAEGYAIDLPAKPTVDERKVEIAGKALPMHVRAAHAQSAVFAIAAIDLPSDDPQLRQAVTAALRGALARNVGAAPVEQPVRIPLSAGDAVIGVDVLATGAAGQAHERRTIHAWIVARGPHVYQAAIVGEQPPAREQVDQFFDSFKLL